MKMKTMEQQIISAVYEFTDIEFKCVEDAIEEYGTYNVFNFWMKSQFLIGYTEPVLQCLKRVGIISIEQEVDKNEKAD